MLCGIGAVYACVWRVEILLWRVRPLAFTPGIRTCTPRNADTQVNTFGAWQAKLTPQCLIELTSEGVQRGNKVDIINERYVSLKFSFLLTSGFALYL